MTASLFYNQHILLFSFHLTAKGPLNLSLNCNNKKLPTDLVFTKISSLDNQMNSLLLAYLPFPHSESNIYEILNRGDKIFDFSDKNTQPLRLFNNSNIEYQYRYQLGRFITTSIKLNPNTNLLDFLELESVLLKNPADDTSLNHQIIQLFDETFYLKQRPDLLKNEQALTHYLNTGAYQGYNPNRFFNSTYYLEKYPHIANSKQNPLIHYVKYGANCGFNPNPFFNSAFYLAQDEGLIESNINPLLHFLKNGLLEGRKINPLNINTWANSDKTLADLYAQGYTEVYIYPFDASIPNSHNQLQSQNKSNIIIQFNQKKYLQHYPDVKQAIADGDFYNALNHYENSGFFEIKSNQRQTFGKQKTNPEINLKVEKQGYLKDCRKKLSLFLKNQDFLDFTPQPSLPKISVILVLFNQAELTLACLKSLIKHNNLPIELIVIDNNSTDLTDQLLASLKGVKVIKNQTNQHFLMSCNQAREYVTTEHMLLLNNDTQITQKALEFSYSRLIQDHTIGAVGGKIVLLDGTLQEAGNIIWNDGSCLGYGRGESENAFPYNFEREVDYCSGAFLMTRTNIWDEMGGFKTIYSPAYYEETDYCTRLYKSGYRVLYLPQVKIYHFEFASSNSYHQAIQQQQKNQKIFFQEHKKVLSKRKNPDLKNILIARYAAFRPKKNLLYIDDKHPHISYGSGFPRANFILNTLSENNINVTCLPLNFPQKKESWKKVYSDINTNIEIAFEIGQEKLPIFLNEREGFYDYIWISRPDNMKLLVQLIKNKQVKIAHAKIIYDAEAIFSLRDIQKAKLNRAKKKQFKKLNKLLDQEIKLCANADNIITVSENESSEFLKRGVKENKIFVLGHAMDINPSRNSFDKRKDLLFVGNMDYDDSPNVDSVKWFVNNVLPLIIKEIPDIVFHLVGSNSSNYIRKLEKCDSKHIKVHGRVDNLDTFYDSCKVFVAPTRYAAGLPHKIHAAVANGIPVVCTELLLKQLGWNHNVDLLVSDEAQKFSEHCISLYRNKKVWREVNANGNKALQKDCDKLFYQKMIKEILIKPV